MKEKKEILKKISNAISKFETKDIFNNSLDLFNVLGYNTKRQSRLDSPTFHEFEQNYLEQNDNIDIDRFKAKAKPENWEKIEILFQLTDTEMSSQASLFDTGKFEDSEIYSYLFIAVELKGGNYSRTVLSDITRQINRAFSMPVLLLFKNGDNLTLSIIKRRLHKKDTSRDVLEKVTLVKDINIENPHRAHLEILYDLSLEKLKEDHTVANFVELQKAWQKTLDSTELNRKFYRDIANWYFWAIKKVEFPDDLEKDISARNATAIIRLLTRLVFIWFIKEKSVIPDDIFKKDILKNILKDFNNPENSDKTIFYKAILQNLFFATLSTEKDKRKFRETGWVNNRNPDFGNQYVYRYENLVEDTDKWKALFADIPFLNGGLFENLDDKKEKLLVDGFSEETRNKLSVPDYLFFSEEKSFDLNETFDTKGKNYKIKGLLKILNQYKFTIAENTPIEEEIALDPELLGKVFENLLASFNPETKTTARKQTGSFYTPREIVDYMVDESLKTSLSNIVSNKLENTTPDDIKAGFDILFAYTEKEHAFTQTEVKEIIKAVSKIKIIDPACGSGAYPMGILHKLTFILNKLDPENMLWKELQKDRAIKETEDAYNLGNREERRSRLKEIEETFESNTSDYGRKLYLIENAIYGVDIQPIAVQISKLRFFISLIVDQDMKTNIKPLPNLETKFVAANTLIGRKKIEAQLNLNLFDNAEIDPLEEELKIVRHKHFRARNSKDKIKIRKKDSELRDKITTLVEQQDGNDVRSSQLGSWNPYDQNQFASFFDSEWMYGLTHSLNSEQPDGFDVVIGNPPYIQIQKFSGKQIQKDLQNEKYETFAKTGDIYSLFYEKGNQLLKNGGVLAFITSNKWMRANYGKATRKYFSEHTNPLQLIDFGGYKVFESATVDTNILIFEKNNHNKNDLVACTVGKDFTNATDVAEYIKENGVILENLGEESWIISSKEEHAVKERIEKIGTPLKDWDVSINYGIKTGYNEAFIVDGAKKDELIAQDPKSAEIIKPILRGRDIKRYKAEFADKWLINSHNGYFDNDKQERVAPIDIEDYPAIKKHLDNYWDKISKRTDKGVTPYNLRHCAYLQEFEKEKIVYPETTQGSYFYYDEDKHIIDKTGFILIGTNLKYTLSVISSIIVLYYFKKYCGGVVLGKTAFQYNKHAVENLLIPKIPKTQQLPFEILVDCILFAKENDLNTEAETFESVIDGMVYDLYFEEEMKKADCYITDRIAETVKPFREDDTDEFKTEYIKKLHNFCRKDNTVFHGIIHRRNIKAVKIIEGDKNER
jgi:adenine-specific DNA-methyltransferase